MNDHSSENVDAWFTARRFGIFLAVIIFANFPQVFLGNHTFFYRDYLTVVFPYAQYNHDCFWRGELPLWNPLNHCGVPYLAQWQTFVLYPGWWIFLPFSPSWSVGIFTLLHLYVGGLAMYFLAYRWTGSRVGACVAGVVYTFNGLTQNSLMWPHIIAALAWAPIVILAVERAWQQGRKAILVAAFAGTMQMLTGAPEQILFTWLIVTLLLLLACLQQRLLAPKYFARVLILVFCITLLSAAQVLPFLDLLKHSQRDTAFASSREAHQGSLSWAVPGWGWANLFVPLFNNFRGPSGVYFQATQFLTSSYYLGVSVLMLTLLSVCGKRIAKVYLLGALLLIAYILALGEHGFLYAPVLNVFPILGFMRYPAKFMFVAAMIAPLLAAYAIARWQNSSVDRQAIERRILVLLGTTFILLIAGIVWFAKAHPLNPKIAENWSLVLQSGWTRALFLIFTVGALVVWQKTAHSSVRIAGSVLLILAVWLDLQTHAPVSPAPTAPRWTLQPGLVKMNPPLPKHGESRALLTLNAQLKVTSYQSPDAEKEVIFNRLIMLHQCNLIDGVPVIRGAHSLLIPESSRVADMLVTTNEPRVGIADFLGVSQISDAQTLEWQPRTNFLPLITGGQQPIFADEKSNLQALVRQNFDPHKMVLLPEEARVSATVTNAGNATILAKNISAHELEFETESASGAWVVVAQSFYHFWRAEVDGKPAKIWKANYGFQALETPTGRHKVRLLYRDYIFRIGSVISFFALVGCVGSWIFFLRKERNHLPQADAR